MASQGERRTAIAHARVTPAELERWQAKAAAAGVPLSELMRRAMRRVRVWTAAASDIERARVREIARVGNNRNQIGRGAKTNKAGGDAAEVSGGLVAGEREIAAAAEPVRTDGASTCEDGPEGGADAQ